MLIIIFFNVVFHKCDIYRLEVELFVINGITIYLGAF